MSNHDLMYEILWDAVQINFPGLSFFYAQDLRMNRKIHGIGE